MPTPLRVLVGALAPGALPRLPGPVDAPAGTLLLDLAFLESPHRLAVHLLPDGTITIRWGTTPLDFGMLGSTLGQQAPRPLG